MKIVTIDFETFGIEARPHYPPLPVGVSIKIAGTAARYLAWGHPSGNNSTLEEARKKLKEVWTDRDIALLFHHAKFDIDVAETHLGMPRLPWWRYHDTLFLLFLHDPHAASLSLKPSAERLLGVAPEEQDAVRSWLVDHGVVRSNDNKWGAHICEAPGGLVGRYAKGDVNRTYALFARLHLDICLRGMEPAYDRERRLLPILLDNERIGIRVDTARLRNDIDVYQGCMTTVDTWLRKRLNARDLNLDSDGDLAEALSQSGVVSDWALTPTGQRSVGKNNLTPAKFSDARIASALGYRTRLATCLSTFALPWLELADANSGRIATNWNQVRGDKFGTRTGRPSTSEPNFLNVPKTFLDKGDGYVHPTFLRSLRPLPLMREYLLPDDACLWAHRDYNQQELRIVAHYEDGELCAAYNADVALDMHTYVQQQIETQLGVKLSRRPVKNLNFGYIYGMGISGLAARMDITHDEARALRGAQMKAAPGLKELSARIKSTVAAGLPIHTWGGREYYVEPPKLVDGRVRDFGYKLLNYLIQGSAADATKEAVIRYSDTKVHGRFLVTVYDEINISVPLKHYGTEMRILKDCMEGLDFGVPMYSDGRVGKSWGSLRTEDEYNE